MNGNENNIKAKDLNQQALVLLEAGNLELAKEKLDKAIEIDPMLVENYINSGNYHVAKEAYQEAKNAYKKALLIEARGEVYFLLGNACFLLDQTNEGIENYNLAIKNGYDNEEMMYFTGMAYENIGNNEMAIRFFQKACDKNPVRSDYQIKKIMAMIKNNWFELAEEETDRLVETTPELFDGYNLKTLLLRERGAMEEAIMFSKMASDKFPEDVDLRFNYVKTVALTGNLDEALKLIEDTVSFKYYADAEFKYVLLKAQILAEQGKLEDATRACEACVALEQDDKFFGEARFTLLNLYITKLDFNAALKYATDFVNSARKDVYYYASLYYRAFCLKQLGQLEKANHFYREANSIYRLETLKNPASIDVYMYRIMCLKDLEMYDEALELSDFIIGVNGEIAEVYVLRSEIFGSLGKKALSEQALAKAYQLKPELKPITEA